MLKRLAFVAPALIGLLACQAVMAAPSSNAQIVRRALNDMFVKRDPRAAEKYFSPQYIQHNPHYPNGRDVLPGLIANLPADFKFETGLIVAQGDLVMVHNRYSGIAPKPMIAVDIYRVRDGRIVEHWDVLQEETPASASQNGNAMFNAGER